MSKFQLHILLEEDDDGGFVAYCPALPGCVSEGDTQEEALENIKDAIKLWLETKDQIAIKERHSTGLNTRKRRELALAVSL